eukprot:10465184-Karenia_brevis.AAC.1
MQGAHNSTRCAQMSQISHNDIFHNQISYGKNLTQFFSAPLIKAWLWMIETHQNGALTADANGDPGAKNNVCESKNASARDCSPGVDDNETNQNGTTTTDANCDPGARNKISNINTDVRQVSGNYVRIVKSCEQKLPRPK